MFSRNFDTIVTALVLYYLAAGSFRGGSSPMFAMAFTTPHSLKSTKTTSTATTTGSSSTLLFASRRSVLEASMVGALASIVLSPTFAWADEGIDDLAMPTKEEQMKDEEDAMKERLRKKAELQKALAKPATFQESMQMEMKKQESLKKSQLDRRTAMCEELGRGC